MEQFATLHRAGHISPRTLRYRASPVHFHYPSEITESFHGAGRASGINLFGPSEISFTFHGVNLFGLFSLFGFFSFFSFFR